MTKAKIDLENVRLKAGRHDDRSEGVCLMEAVAWFAGEQHSDHPACVSPVLGAYGRALNDRLAIAERQGLVKFIPRLAGTAGDGLDQARAFMAADAAIRIFAPAALDSAGLSDRAGLLRELPAVTDNQTADAAYAAAAAAAADADAASAAYDAADLAALRLFDAMITCKKGQ